MKKILIILTILTILIIPNILSASGLSTSDLNYINDHVGGRAIGMGGAFCAVSDDPSGAYYNPAGMIFAIDNQISLSVNSYKSKTTKIDGVIGGKDYIQDISSFYPSFFGVIQTFGKYKVGFSFVNINNEILDQDSYFKNLNLTDSAGEPVKSEFLMNYNISENTMLAGPSFSTFISQNVSFGLSFYGLKSSKQQIANQMVINNSANEKTYEIINLYITDDMYGLLPVFGLQYMPFKEIAFGTSLQYGYILSHKRQTQYFMKSSAGGSDMNAVDSDDVPLVQLVNSKGKVTSSKYPLVWRNGIAYFPSEKLILSFDIIAHLAIAGFSDMYFDTPVQNTFNWAAGMEYFVIDQFPIRFGIFTNMANTPEVSKSLQNQEMHINMYGGSTSISWQTKSSAVTLGGYLQYGEGEAQAVGGTTQTQKASILLYSIALTGSAMY